MPVPNLVTFGHSYALDFVYPLKQILVAIYQDPRWHYGWQQLNRRHVQRPFGGIIQNVYSFGDFHHLPAVMQKALFDKSVGKPGSDTVGKTAFAEFINSAHESVTSTIVTDICSPSRWSPTISWLLDKHEVWHSQQWACGVFTIAMPLERLDNKEQATFDEKDGYPG